VFGNQIEELIKIYNAKFGLDKPLYVQYLNYWSDLLHLNLGQSLALYPQTALNLILQAAPWTLGLLTVSTLLAFVLGTGFGALMAWPKTSGIALALSPLFMTLSAIPYYLLGVLFVYVVALGWRVLPIGGGISAGGALKLNWPTIVDLIRHAILPAASIVLA